ncbi:MAG: ABC transporter permease [Thermoleophilaceae bacterium]
MEALLQDLRYAARSLRKSPGFTAVAVLTLALGIGATTAIFVAVNAVLLEPLPYPDSHELVRIYDNWRGEPWTVSPPNFMDYRSETDAFADMTGYHRASFTMTDPGEAEELSGARVTGGFFRVLGAQPAIGGGIDRSHETVGNDRVAVLGDGLWHRRFGGDPNVVGRTIELDGEAYTVLGVAPSGFDHPTGAELWVPRSFTADALTERGAHYLDVVGRLAPGATIERAQADLAALSRRLAKEYPDANGEVSALGVPMLEAAVGDYRGALLILLGAVGLLLLIACVNVANLALARASGRRRELAIRAALGAGRLRLARESLSENFLVALLGGALGFLLALWGADALAALQEDRIPRLGEIGLDGRVLLFAGGLVMLTGALFGLLPAIRESGHADLSGALKEGTAGAGRGQSAGRLRASLVIAQVALAVVLVAGAGLLMRSFVNLRQVDPGFRTERILAFDLSLPEARYTEPYQARDFFAELLDEIETLPGVEEAAGISGLPLSGAGYSISVEELDGGPAYTDPAESKNVQVRVATAGYFRLMGIDLLRGRGFTSSDGPDVEPVAIVNESAAGLLWGREDVVDRSLELGTRLGLDGEHVGGRIVGVVSDTREYGPAEEPVPTVYAVHAQFPDDGLTIVARSSSGPNALVRPIRRLIDARDPDLAMVNVETLERLMDEAIANPRFYTLLLGIFAWSALLLAAVGIYGVMAYTVEQRAREMAIRRALGASGARVLRLVLESAGLLALLGIAIGLLGAFGLTRVMHGLLYGVSATDPATLAVAVAILFAVALLASWLPARRAMRVEPVDALRAE